MARESTKDTGRTTVAMEREFSHIRVATFTPDGSDLARRKAQAHITQRKQTCVSLVSGKKARLLRVTGNL